MSVFIIFIAFFLSACAAGPDVSLEENLSLTLKQAQFSDLPGWRQGEDLDKALSALSLSCVRIIKKDPEQQVGKFPESGTYGDWQRICRDLKLLDRADGKRVRTFIEQTFTPWQVRAGEDPEGLFTGYYESSLKGSRYKQGPYRYPLHARPDDLVMVQLGDFREDLKGRRIAGRVIDGQLKPYESREAIVEGRWPHNDHVLVWVDNPVDAFFVQIQGSGVVEMNDGSLMRIGYAGQNGHPYYAVGRELVKRGALEKDKVSMQSIRSWLENNPDQADELMNTNRSYVFFREQDQDGAIGGEGVVLTPGHSLAVDHTLLPYGIPLWVDIDPPTNGEPPLRRLMIAQDTGGAIRGPVRGDVFWGHGSQAEHLAGHMKSQGRYWVLLPKKLQ